VSTAKQSMPIQFPVLRKSDFESDSGISVVNQHFAQIATFLNALTGVAGPTTLPSGVDVQGAAVTGLGAPTGPTDAISSGHASASYGAQAQQPQLDLGGRYTLKGLAATYQTSQQNSQAIASAAAGSFNNVTGSRSFGTVFRNTTGSKLFVSAVGNLNLGAGHNASALGYVGATSSPATLVSGNSVTNGPGWASAFFMVPASWYYKVLTQQGTDTDPLTLVAWGEWN
jgi:hypothetical protein